MVSVCCAPAVLEETFIYVETVDLKKMSSDGLKYYNTLILIIKLVFDMLHIFEWRRTLSITTYFMSIKYSSVRVCNFIV